MKDKKPERPNTHPGKPGQKQSSSPVLGPMPDFSVTVPDGPDRLSPEEFKEFKERVRRRGG